MQKSIVFFAILIGSKFVFATELSLDIEFIEWLGETAQMEEVGVDIDRLLQNLEDSAEKTEEKNK